MCYSFDMVETMMQITEMSPMEIFLLAAIARGGLRTLYALQQEAGLQPGSIKGALNHLEDGGLLSRSQGAKRGRRDMSVTATGEEFLRSEWAKCLDPAREIESVLRSATVALWMADAARSAEFLRTAASMRMPRRARPGLMAMQHRLAPMEIHAHLRETYEDRRRGFEEQLLEEFSTYLRDGYER